MKVEIIRNEGQFGPGRMDWLLVCDGQLVSHCGMYHKLEEKVEVARAALRVSA